MRLIPVLLSAVPFLFLSCQNKQPAGNTTLTNWQDGKAAAVSLTFDDGSPNQFSQALPILDELKLPATFYLVTGEVAGSEHTGKFIGRPFAEIARGTGDTLTNKDNFFERASALAYSDYQGAVAFHSEAGSLYEQGKLQKAYHLLDSGYKSIRAGVLKKSNREVPERHLNWQQVKAYAARGHEFASHTVTHPRLAVLTEPNLVYELEKSRQDILTQLGGRYTFSAECPYGTEDERVMSYAYKIYPALRNRMPEPFLGEINRGSKTAPGTVNKEYVQWQRGATTKTPLPLMKSWVDTVTSHRKDWLVLVFHGVDGVGWEALPHQLLREYFEYIRDKEEAIWVATFADVSKYIREKMHANVKATASGDKIDIVLTHSLDKTMYDVPLTLKTYVEPGWESIEVKQGTNRQVLRPKTDADGSYVLYRAQPNSFPVELSKEAGQAQP